MSSGCTPVLLSYFNPRSPRGERQRINAEIFVTVIFQSTLPAWGATLALLQALFASIFQSTLPAWGATVLPYCYHYGYDISIHAPRVGSDATLFRMGMMITLFQSTLPAWGATRDPVCGFNAVSDFNPRSPRGERHNY